MRFRLVTWNINSVRKRIALLDQIAREVSPDVICLQETKVDDDKFPLGDIHDIGYPHCAFRGIKGYNGVAILSKFPLTDIAAPDWCEKSDGRHIQAAVPDAGGIEVHNFYVPAGGDDPDPDLNPKFSHKLQFLREMADWGAGLPARTSRVLVGDLNVAPLDTDVWSHTALLKIVSHTPIEIEHLDTAQTAHDWLDVMRHFVPPEEHLYTWWSYRARDWRAANKGRRLDHVWITPDMKDKLTGMLVMDEVRGWETPSDHAPVLVDFEI